MISFPRSIVVVGALAGLPLALAACAAKAPPGAAPTPINFAEAILYDTKGKQSGKVTFLPEGDMLAGEVTVSGGLTAGAHGMHIHTIGKCTLPDFVSAGGHLNPDGKQHGLQNPMGSHQGDLPMIVANAGGAGSMTFTVHGTLDGLFDADGTAFVIHAAPDDMKTDPTGNSGARVMCGVIYRKAG